MPSKTVGTSAVQLVTDSTPARGGVWVKASTANAADSYVYVGFANTVTAGTGVDATDGFELGPGEAFLFPARPGLAMDARNLWLIGSDADLEVSWLAVN
jgi:hypothetical protein